MKVANVSFLVPAGNRLLRKCPNISFLKCFPTWKLFAARWRWPWHIVQLVGSPSASCSTSASCWSPGRSRIPNSCCSCSCTLSTLPRLHFFACFREPLSLVLDASVPYFNLDSLPARQSLTVMHRLPENENGLLTPFDLRSGEKEGGGAFDPGNVCCLTPGEMLKSSLALGAW